MFFSFCLDFNMDDIKETIIETVVVVVGESMKKEIPEALKLFEENLNSNTFIIRAVQNSILREFLACFECLLCKETASIPIIVSTCCESVIDCSQCVTKMFQSDTSACPKCRSEECIALRLKRFDIITRLNQG